MNTRSRVHRKLWRDTVDSQLSAVESLLTRFCNREVEFAKLIYAFTGLKDMMRKRSRHTPWKQNVINRIAAIQAMMDMFAITENE